MDAETSNANEAASNDEVQIVALNDTNNKSHPDEQSTEQPPMPRAGTTVIHQSEASQVQHHEHHHHHHHHNPEKKGKELSRVPYELERLRKKRPLLDALRATKLRDLFRVSYVFRYFVCCVVGCLGFMSLAILWKFVLDINTCRIENNPPGKWVAMPFKYGFVTAYKNGLLILGPLLFVLLPTVGVVARHRIKFIATFLFIFFVVFTSYGFYAVSWREYQYISSGVLGLIAMVIFFYHSGYYAIWIVFPFFSAIAVGLTLISVTREYVWSVINHNTQPFLFGLVYPWYLTLLQQIMLKVMLWSRLPYKIRRAFLKCCPQCCCRNHVYKDSATVTNTDLITPVFYDNYTETEHKEDHFWMTSISFSFKLKYVDPEQRNSEQQLADLHTAEVKKHGATQTMPEIKEEETLREQTSDTTTAQSEEKKAEDDKQEQVTETVEHAEEKTKPEEDKQGKESQTVEQEKKMETDHVDNADDPNAKHENTDTQIVNTEEIVRIKTKHSSSHRYKSTELQLTVEDVWSNDILFVAGGTVIVLMESMRVAGMLAFKDNIGGLIFTITSSIVLECFMRNNLYMEFLYRCCLKRENPPLSRFQSSIYGTQFQTEYIPYIMVAMMNLMVFGPPPPWSCFSDSLDESVSLPFDEYWWMYILLFLSEMLSDLLAECVKKLGRKRGIFGNEYGDPARKATFVKLKPVFMLCVFVAFFALSFTAFMLDFDAKQGN